MTVTLVGTGGLLTRMGRDGGMTNAVNAFRGTADLSGASIVSAGVGFNHIEAQYQSSRQDLADGIYAALTSYRGVHGQVLTYLQQHASNVLQQMFSDDGSIRVLTNQSALTALISQMNAASSTVQTNTVSVSTATGGSNAGTAAIGASVKNFDGTTLQYPFAEVINFSATSDSQTGTAVLGSESWTVNGAISQPDFLAYNWPLGSALTATMQTINPSGSLNLLVNGPMENWTTNVPNNWVVDVGTAGTTIFQGTSTFRGGAFGLQFTGTGSELTAVKQQFGNSSGTSYVLLPDTVYAFSCWAKVSTVSSEAGVLSVSIVDNTGTVVNNAAGGANTIATTLLGTVGTSFVNIKGFFQTPAVLSASAYYLRIKLTTALTNATLLIVDDVCMAIPKQLYAGGPYVAIFPGNTAVVIGDSFTATVANNFAGAFQTIFQRWFNMSSLGLTLPNSGSPTISDSLVA